MNNKGFSLIELIVVTAIMIILTAIVVPNISGYIGRAREVTDKTNMKSIYTASLQYIQDCSVKNDKSLSSITEDEIKAAIQTYPYISNLQENNIIDLINDVDIEIENGNLLSVKYNGYEYP